jgi:hypothetical protein
MTLPIWTPADSRSGATFSINVADLSYVDLVNGNLAIGTSAHDLAQLALVRSCLDGGISLTLQLSPRALNMPVGSPGDQVSIGGTIQGDGNSIVDGNYLLAVARERSLSTLTAVWVDFTDGGKVASTDNSLLERFTGDSDPRLT